MEAARKLVEVLATLPRPLPLRVVDAEGEVACLIQVWNTNELMPTVGMVRHKRAAEGGREECRADILAVIAAAGNSLTRKEVVQALKSAGRRHGEGTVVKALADLTAAGHLLNPKDKKGYRLPGWGKPGTPSLFD